MQILEGDIEIENRTDTYRAKETNKCGLSKFLDLWNVCMHGKDDRDSPEQEH